MASNAVALSASVLMPLLAGDCLITADSQLDSTPLTQLGRLSNNSLGEDPKENTSPHSPPTAA
jgi:hypothetical protein